MNIAALYKNAYGGLSRGTWLLSVVMLINRAGAMVLAFMTLYLTEAKHFSPGQAGLAMALFGMGAISGGLIGGKLVDRFGFYPVQIISLIGGGLLFIAMSYADTLPEICAISFIQSLVNDSFRPANSAAIAHYSKPENRSRSYALNRLAINLGWAAGVSVGGFIASVGYQYLFWGDGLTNIAAAILLFLLLRPSKAAKNTPAQTETSLADVNAVIRSPYKDRVYLAFIVVSTMFFYCFFQTFCTMNPYYQNVLHMSKTEIGAVNAMNGIIIAFVEMLLVFRLEGKKHALHLATIGSVVCAFGFFVVNFQLGGIMLAVVSVLLLTFGEMLSMPFMNAYWVTRSHPSNRGQYAGLYSSTWAVAQILAPVTGGYIVQYLGYTFLWWYIGAICLLAAVGFKWLQHRTTRHLRMIPDTVAAGS